MDLSLGCTRLLIDESKRQGLLRNQCAYVLATSFWETAHTMRPVVEAYWLSENWRRNNLRYYPWFGRGFVQLTWEKNYQRAERETGSPVHQNPQLALDPVVASKIAVTGMKEGWFTGRDLNDFIDLQHSDFKGARAIINGKDKDDEIAAIARQYDADLKREGYN
ncbi:glycoside hydrolase family 19 protein [Mesorhizobium sp. ESP-6-2]|uniref:glycoside hydrolase family 19 protein n=1 Tax=Mesorhizobium sp. ESP-6-2 TaxID=2876625 RepID=UPI001CCBD44A|nr:glycoside hydrolase family 19 protein [Mesorhizobium sp. ESP-6-2]MBZ9807708.1 carboxypeptidase [Mesorhizobium sp. ESP-6-2]